MQGNLYPIFGTTILVYEEAGTTAERLVGSSLPLLLLFGWLVASTGELGLPIWISIIACLLVVIIATNQLYREVNFSRRDLRWLFVPSLVLTLGWIDPMWSTPMQWDQSDHLQTANRYLGRWEWEPYHMGMDFSFRPKIMSGLLAVELALTGKQFEAYFVPLACIISCGWQVQLLAERYNRIAGGIVASIVVLTLPAMLVYGRTAYLEALATGGLILVFRHSLQLFESGEMQIKYAVRLGILCSLIGAVKYPYLYLGPALALLAWKRRMGNVMYLLFAWLAVQCPFLASDLVFHSDPLASLGPQASGAVNSAIGDYGSYGAGQALVDVTGEISVPLLACLISGALFWMSTDLPNRAPLFTVVVMPSIVLFSVVLDFGYPRYHLPWLSLVVCIACNWFSGNPIPSLEKWKSYSAAPSIATVLVLLLVTQQILLVTNQSLDSRSYNLDVIDSREENLEEFMEFGDHLPEDAIVLSGFDITLGVRFGVPTYRFGPSDDPLHDSIVMVDASHVVIGGRVARFDWESDSMTILGAPLYPVVDSSRTGAYATLWGVDEARSSRHDEASSLDLGGSMRHVGDMVLASEGMTVTTPQNWRIVLVVDLSNNESEGAEAIDLIFNRDTDASRLCEDSSCPLEVMVPEGTRYLVQVEWINEG